MLACVSVCMWSWVQTGPFPNACCIWIRRSIGASVHPEGRSAETAAPARTLPTASAGADPPWWDTTHASDLQRFCSVCFTSIHTHLPSHSWICPSLFLRLRPRPRAPGSCPGLESSVLRSLLRTETSSSTTSWPSSFHWLWFWSSVSSWPTSCAAGERECM